ncbi:hypothetical protein E4U30_008112 [Claviceps sp. LM220 group G6]|nr:hypothetical protein E4U30_008112 [Claviceps sp. LM220 group G6]
MERHDGTAARWHPVLQYQLFRLRESNKRPYKPPTCSRLPADAATNDTRAAIQSTAHVPMATLACTDEAAVIAF